ncbi:MAG: amidase [Deltaproteobacteria bacterium]|nr:amidase [Deltaproteobacteria bacterium]
MGIFAPFVSESILELPAVEQARRIRQGRLRSESLVELYLDRIERLDGEYAAFVAINREKSLQEARRIDRLRCKESPFLGVPTGIKDLYYAKGFETRYGSDANPWFPAPFDGPHARTLKKAGFIIVGKTSTSELSLLPVVDPQIHPPTRNPWDASRYAGGSSGGAGAAVSARMLPIAPGSDGAGSIRIPAACCGLFGHKPSPWRIPHLGAHWLDPMGLIALGPIARNVEDGATLFDVLMERDPEEPDSMRSMSRSKGPRMKIGLLCESPLGRTSPAHAQAATEAARALARAGHQLVDIPPIRASVDEFLPVYTRFIARIPVLFEKRLEALTRWFRAEGRRHTKAEEHQARNELVRRLLGAFGDCDIILSPTIPIPPPKVGAHHGMEPASAFRELAHLGAFTAMANLLRAPASTLPWSICDGLPVGLQLLGRSGEDARVIALAGELEALRGGPFPPPPLP